MAIELKIPEAGESVTEAMIGEWLVKEGDWVDVDQSIAVIETDKVNLELPAPEAGVISKLLKEEGDEAAIGETVAHLEPQAKPDGAASAGDEPAAETSAETSDDSKAGSGAEPKVMPAAQRLLDQHGIDAGLIEATGKSGHVLKEDVQRYLDAAQADKSAAPEPAAPTPAESKPAPAPEAGARSEEVVKLTMLRRRVAERLVASQQEMAQLTTFNDCDMSAVIGLRKEYQERFVAKYGFKLGFMSFFVKAVIEGLKEIPQLNAEMRDDSLVFRNYYDIGVAVGGGKGLVVPVIRNAERLSFAGVENTISDLAKRARDNKLSLEDLQGGTFTISNGGIYGSLLSTPIVNPPQSGILGMHRIEERPVAVNGQVEIRPMMYLALSYDHRIVDGREAVTFLKRVKETIENPERILLEV